MYVQLYPTQWTRRGWPRGSRELCACAGYKTLVLMLMAWLELLYTASNDTADLFFYNYMQYGGATSGQRRPAGVGGGRAGGIRFRIPDIRYPPP